jgi:hypothetical protein
MIPKRESRNGTANLSDSGEMPKNLSLRKQLLFGKVGDETDPMKSLSRISVMIG